MNLNEEGEKDKRIGQEINTARQMGEWADKTQYYQGMHRKLYHILGVSKL